MDAPAGRRGGRSATGALLLSGLAVIGAGSAPAAAEGSFRALAAADGARVSVIAVNSPGTNVPFDAGAPVAQAALDSLGTNQSFASQPYPGDVVISGPGLIAGVTNGQVTLPNYPFYVSADYPIVPEQTVQYPGYELKATAAEREAAASARSGGSSDANAALLSAATARTTNDGSTVTGEASSVATGFAAGPLTIGRINAKASVSRQPDGTLARRSGLEISGAKVGETAVSISPQGIAVGSANTPVPDGSALTKALTDAGVTVKYLAGRDTETGLVAPALEVSWTRAVPGPVSPITLVWTLGRAVARIDGGGGIASAGPGVTTAAGPEAFPLTPEPGSASSVPTIPPVSAAAERAAGVLTVPSSGTSSIGSPSGGDTLALAASPPDTGPAASVAAPPPTRTFELASPARLLAPPDFDTRSTFGVLVLALVGAWIVSRGWAFGRRQSNQ